MATSGNTSISVTSWDSLKFSWWQSGDQNITNNTTTVGWKLELIATGSGRIDSSASKAWSVTVNGTKYSGTNTVGISNNSTKTLASGYTNIAHNADGSKTFSYSFTQQFDINFNGWVGTKSGSGSGTLNTIPRKSTLSVSNGTLGTSQRLTITEAASGFNHKLYASSGSSGNIYIVGSSSATSSTLNADWTPPASLASQNTTGTSVSVKFTLETYNGSTLIGTNTYTQSFTIPNTAAYRPSCSITLEDTTGHTTTYGSPVQGMSKIKITVSPTLAYGSPIDSYAISGNGASYTSTPATTGVLKGSGSVSFSATVKDKRGRSGSASKSLTVLAYAAPKISTLTVHRCDQNGTENAQGAYIRVTFSSRITALNNKNTAAYTLKWRKSTESSFASNNTVTLDAIANAYTVSGYSYIFAAAIDSSYVVELQAKDRHGSDTRATSASTAFSLINWGADGTSMAIGKEVEADGANLLDIGLQTRLAGGLLPPIIPPNEDLNNVKTPNTYVGANLSTYNYKNCPLASGTFILTVEGAGDEGQLRQRLTYCHKEMGRTYERFFYQSGWGSWVCTSDYDGTLLWEGTWYMQASHTLTMAEPVKMQKNGIVLVFTEYIDGAAGNSAFHSFFIPKMQIANHPDKGYTFTMATSKFGFVASKYLYINNTVITGHNDNNTTGTSASGITYTNNRFVLRYVIGV